MTLKTASMRWAAALLINTVAAMPTFGQDAVKSSQPLDEMSRATSEPITVKHALGTTVIAQQPKRVAALDINEVDFLDVLDVPVAGTVQDFVPHFLSRYKSNPDIADLGFIVQPNIESVYRLQPDLVLITSLHAGHYRELSRIAPTNHFDVDYRNSETGHIDIIKDHLMTLGRIFGKGDAALRTIGELDAKIDEARRIIEGRPETALIVLHNNGAYASYGVQSRYGFIFDAFDVKPAATTGEAGLHGQPISNEFIQQANPDIIYVIDRTAVMEHRPVMDIESMSNPLLRQTNAWKNGRVIFVDAEAWYVTGASPTSLEIIIDDVLKGYRD